MTALYTHRRLVSLTIDQLNSYSAIQVAANDLTTPIRIVLLDSGRVDLLDKIGSTPVRIFVATGNNWITAGDGYDTVMGGEGSDRLFGGQGNDLIEGGLGADRLFGGGGDDKLVGGLGNDQIFGGRGNDRLYGSENDTLLGGKGDDKYYLTGASNPTIYELAGEGNDTLFTDRSVGSPIAGLENITVIGGDNVSLVGNELANILKGDDTANTFSGNGGNDTMTGGGFIDYFIFNDPNSVDTITDFNPVEDAISLFGPAFDGIIFDGGHIDASMFKIISLEAEDSTDRILYNLANGNLLYDEDGVGGVAPVLFAILKGHPFLTENDIFVSL